MKNYKKIHIWDFPLNQIFVRLSNKFREELVSNLLNKFKSEPLAIGWVNKASINYGFNKKYSRGSFYIWKKGFAGYKKKKVTKNFPLWVLIEISKRLSNSSKINNGVMEKIEKNVEYYCSIGGANRIYNPKLPILVTPEFASIIFHFCGDGHLAINSRTSSSYRQLNKNTLNIVYDKLVNCFGDFRKSLRDGKLYIPKSIADIYSYYFSIRNNKWNNARIPNKIKSLSKEFLVAGLVSFMIDEANICEVIEIYSKNYGLLKDIREVAIKCGYKCRDIRRKYRYGSFDSYRFLVSSESYLDLHRDITNLRKDYPLCHLAHKNQNFSILVKRKNKKVIKNKEGITKDKIVDILRNKSSTIYELVEILNISHSSVRELLWKLEKENRIKREGRTGRSIIWSVKNHPS